MKLNITNTPYRDTNRSIRIFVSSTFKDMIEERDELMTYCWPELRKFCKERYLELIEVDMRWGISEDQSQRKETLKLCLDEIQKCHPFFIGLLGERYGWIPEEESYTLDLLEEQKWLKDIKDRSVTELEILHGVLRDPDMEQLSFFYFRDPEYVKGKGSDFISDSKEDFQKLTDLKKRIRLARDKEKVYLKEDYPNPAELAKLVLKDLMDAIEAQFPIEHVADALAREAIEHDVFAESRRKTYIGRQEYYDKLNQHVLAENTPLVITGDSGIGKTALLANWAYDWRTKHADDFVFEHYIGGTNQSADHWSLMTRLMAEIKNWTDDPGKLPQSHDDILRDFGSWLVKLRMKAELKKVKTILVFDALNQLEDKDHAHVLGWLPEYPFIGSLRLVISTLTGPIQQVLQNRKWELFEVNALHPEESKSLITNYLKRFSKTLDEKYLDDITSYAATNSPLYLKILLDELRVTGTHDGLEEKLNYYLKCSNIPELLSSILDRYKIDYEKEMPNLVSQTLGLIWSARRGLSESELLELLKPKGKDKLQQGIWNPLRSAMDEFLINKNGILSFSHTYIRDAIKEKFVNDLDAKDEYQLELAEYFEKRVEITERSCDELPWLLKETESFERLRECLLDLMRFVVIWKNNNLEFLNYIYEVGNESEFGKKLYQNVNNELIKFENKNFNIYETAFNSAELMYELSLYNESEKILNSLLRFEEILNNKNIKSRLNILLGLDRIYDKAERLIDQETVLYKALDLIMPFALERINHGNIPEDYIDIECTFSEKMANLQFKKGNINDAYLLYTTTLRSKQKKFGENDISVAVFLNNIGLFYMKLDNYEQYAEESFNKALKIYIEHYGYFHPDTAMVYLNLANFNLVEMKYDKCEFYIKRTIEIYKQYFGENDDKIIGAKQILSEVYRNSNKLIEAESLNNDIIKILKFRFGSISARISHVLWNQALIYGERQQLDKASDSMNEAVEILNAISIRNKIQHKDLRIFVKRYKEFLSLNGLSEKGIEIKLMTINPKLVD